MELIPILGLFVFGGLMTYTISERRHRHRWGSRAPAKIRATALWSIYMGQMAVPGGLIGLIGLMAAGIGLVSIPGMILAVRIWRLGFMMLRRDPRAAAEAMALRRFAIVLNVAAVMIAAVLPLFSVDLVGVSLVLIGYGAVSFAHARAMGQCATLLADAEHEDHMAAIRRRTNAWTRDARTVA